MSVIVATYNSRATLACALDSVQRQDCQDFEVWVVGDACTDGSDEVVEALRDPRFHWLNRAQNSGSQALPNRDGLARARGRYVAYLGHDDLWFPWHLSSLIALTEQTGAAFVHGLLLLLGPNGRLETAGPPREPTLYGKHFAPPSCWLHERGLMEQVGGWRNPDELPCGVDVDTFRAWRPAAPAWRAHPGSV